MITLYQSSEDVGEIKELPVIEEDIEMNDKEDEEMIAAEEEPASSEKEPASTTDKNLLAVKEALAVIFPEGVKTSSRAHDIKRVERLFTLVFINKVLVKWAGKECEIPESTAPVKCVSEFAAILNFQDLMTFSSRLLLLDTRRALIAMETKSSFPFSISWTTRN